MATKPKLALIPSAYKAGKVYSVLPSDGVGDFTFSRSGNATRVNKDGFIETVGSNVPRLNYPLIDGVVQGCPSLLLENASTNLVTYSEDFSNSYWVKTGLLAPTSGFISPDGTANASKLVENTSSGNHFITRGVVASLGSAANYALSFYIKKGERSKITASIANSGNYFVNFDLEDVTATIVGAEIQEATIKEIGNDWFYCTILSEIQIGITPSARIYLADDSFSISYQGDGTSGLYIWGAMLEENDYSTSYIPSLTGSQTTRSAETCNGAGNANTFNDSEGVLYCETADINSDITKMITINDGGQTNELRIDFKINNEIQAVFTVGGNPQSIISTTSYNTSEINKIAFKYKENDFALWVNGIEVGTDNSGSTTTTNEFNRLEFERGSGLFQFYGKIKQIQYFNSALTDLELEEMTGFKSFVQMANQLNYTVI